MEPLPGLDSFLAEAAEKAGKYEWMKAAETYRQVVDKIDRAKDPKRAAGVSELLATSYFKAAFQADTGDEFNRRMMLCEKAQEESAVLYEAAGSNGLAKRAEAGALFAKFWSSVEADDKRALLEKSILLVEESARIFEVHGDKRPLVEALRDLMVYREKAVQTSRDRKHLVDHFEKAVETAERILDEFQGAEDQAELETVNLLSRLYVYAEYVIEQPRYEELEKKLAKVRPRINQLSDRIGTASASALRSEAEVILAADLEGNIPKALEAFEKGVARAEETKDHYLLGRLYTSVSACLRFSGLTEEYGEKRREKLDRALQFASNGIRNLQPSSPGVWLKYAYKRYLDASTFLALTTETDFEKKRSVLRRAIDTVNKGFYDKPSFVPGIGHELSKAMYFLAAMNTGPEEQSQLLLEALPIREEVVRTVSMFSPHSWNRGVMLNYLALLRAELAKAESDTVRKLQLLKQAGSDMQQCLQICSTLSANYTVAPPHIVRVQAQYGEWHGDILQEQYEATQDPSVSRQAIAAYREAIAYLSKSATIGPIPVIRWKVAQCHDAFREFAESSESFRQAAQEYKAAGKKIEPLAGVFEDYAKYMEAWAVVEEARLDHERERYNSAAEHYTKVAELLRTLTPWNYLSNHYSACSFLELGEAMSRQERQHSAIDSFHAAQRTFQNAKNELESRLPTSPPQEKRELNSWIEITKGRSKYISGRILLEEAKVLDSRMEEEASSAKYKAASDSFRTLLNETSHRDIHMELEALSIVCEAWAKMKSAEARASPELWAEAAKDFLTAETKATGKKTKLAALANASMCKALEYGSTFRRTRDTKLYEGIKKNLETAADFYEEAGIKKAADWTRATQRYFDALRYLHDAEIEQDTKKRTELFHLAENHLQLAATIYGEAGYVKKKQEALRHLERAREEKQLLSMPVEVLEESPTVSDVTTSPVSLLEDKSPGLEKLRNAHLRGTITVSSTELNAGEKMVIDFQIVNVGKETATLGRIENLAPQGLEPVKEKEAYSIEDNAVNMRGKRLESLKSHKLKIQLRAHRKGPYELRPRITYYDDKGTAETYEFEPKTVTVREIGVLGWIRGPH